MFTTLISVALFSTLAIRGARAQDFSIDTPVFTQCQPATINWTGTNNTPYNLIVVPSDDVCSEELADLGDFYNTSATWTVNVPAGTAVTLSLIDAQDNEAWSGSITIQGSGDSSCLNSTDVSSSLLPSASVASSVISSAVGGATTLAVPSTETATGVVNDGAPPSATTSAAVAIGAAGQGDNPGVSAGFSMHQLSAPIMVMSALAAIVLL